MLQAIERIYREKIAAAARGSHQNTTPLADPHVWKREMEEVMQAIFEGMGTDASSLTDYSNYSATLVRNLQRNLMTFYAFKGHHQAKDMIDALVDHTTGQPRSWHDFKREALNISTQYNVHWLQAEYDTAFGAAQMAEKWQQIVEEADVLGMLKYDAVMDARTRPAHRLLHGTIKPVHDKFWDTYYPPNGWKCRCDVIQLPIDTPEVEPKGYPDDKQHPPAFRANVGKTGEVFTAQHPFFSTLRPHERDAVMRSASRLIFDHYDDAAYYKEAHQLPDWLQTLSKTYPFGYDEASGGWAVIDRLHKLDALEHELPAISLLVRQGKQIEVLREVGIKNPVYDIFMDQVLWDIKRFYRSKVTNTTIKRYFRDAKKKGKKSLLIHIDQEVSVTELMASIKTWQGQYPLSNLAILLDGKLTIINLAKI